MALTNLDGGRLVAERNSDSPQLLALHGWGRDRTDFAKALQGYPYLAVDLPGFGLSVAPDSAWGSLEYAKAIRPVLSAFDVPPVVVAHSFGGRVAIQAAATLNLPLRGLVLTGVPLVRTTARPRRSPVGYRLTKALYQAGLVSDDRIGTARRRYGSADYRNAEGIMREVLVRCVNEDYEPLLGEIRCPVDLVWAVGDLEAPLAGAQEAERLIPHARLTVVPGGDHFSALREPSALRAAIDRLLA
ncbi:MAG: alpha/beta fold hydrolase [Acidimicrobiales bacterium]